MSALLDGVLGLEKASKWPFSETCRNLCRRGGRGFTVSVSLASLLFFEENSALLSDLFTSCNKDLIQCTEEPSEPCEYKVQSHEGRLSKDSET